jgi:hypothetical protein
MVGVAGTRASVSSRSVPCHDRAPTLRVSSLTSPPGGTSAAIEAVTGAIPLTKRIVPWALRLFVYFPTAVSLPSWPRQIRASGY